MGRSEITIIFFIIFFFCTSLLRADQERPNEAENVSVNLRSAEEIVNEFLQDSLKFRLEYDFAGGFFDEAHRKGLSNLCRRTSAGLGNLHELHKNKQAEIEAYEGDDWDKLYGATGLWRKTAQEAEKSIWYKSQADFFLAVCSEQDQREKILGDIIKRCQTGEGMFRTMGGKLLKAEAIAAMGGIAHRQRAKRIVDSILAREDLSEDVYFRGSIVQLKLDKSINRLRVFEIVENLRHSKSKDDFELNARLAFLGLRVGWPDPLEEAVERWPSTEGFIGGLLLEQMVREPGEDVPGDRGVFEVELAAKGALEKGADKYKRLLTGFCSIEKYRTAVVLYGMAKAFEKSEPAKAVRYYLQSTRARQKEKNSRLEIDTARIMRQGAETACDLYYKYPKYIGVCEKALREYFEIAGEKSDERLRYFYAGILQARGRKNEAGKLLSEIAKARGGYSLNARLDLIVRDLRDSTVNGVAKEKIKRQLKELIDSAGAVGEQGKVVKSEAARLYCQLLLESGGEESAREALSILDETALDKGTDEPILKAKALGILGNWDKGVSVLANHIDSNECAAAQEAFSVLSEAVERLEEISERASERDVFVNECKAIADYCIGCLDGQDADDAELLWAELALSGQANKERLSRIEKILAGYEQSGNIAVMRCRARLLAAKGDFAEAGNIWAQICKARQGIERSKSRDRRWWRAKFNQLHCLAKQQGSKKEEIIRSIEILERSFEDIPVFWSRKLKGLKEELTK